ncbi:mannitol dehydrogenase family protein [Telluria beijingensis]|uniref:mannitol dehydrogenase family protein n=1 Tax=Telluria beijingensis TaxID=3068633 RepID=UPI0027957804|nr:mannitol dehydrogenase family protein [Massilia sp. REN29]
METYPNIILHLGLGAFHRAHQADFLQDLHERAGRHVGWTIVAANIRPDPLDPGAVLRAQGCAYTLETVAPDGSRAYRTIRAISDVIAWEPGLARVIAVGSADATRIVSFTVTEAGYLAGATIYGVLTAILRARRAGGAGPLTLLCCDNLRHNGERVRAGLEQFLALAGDSATLDWMRVHASFPNSMVDRITPRPTPALRARVLAATGYDDPAAVGCEAWRDWVIEDDFRHGRPVWEDVGAHMVASVVPYEEAKIRILNASHSCFAWAGALAGHTYIHDSVRDERIRALAHAYVTGAVFDCLHPSPVDLEAYRDAVLARFASDAIADTVERVLADSSAKLAQFIVPTVRERLARALPLDDVAPLPLLYLHFLRRWHAGGEALDYQDRELDPALVRRVCEAPDPLAAFAAEAALWGELAHDRRLLAALRSARPRLAALGLADG